MATVASLSQEAWAAAAETGAFVRGYAALDPDRPAVSTPSGSRSDAQLDRRANQLIWQVAGTATLTTTTAVCTPTPLCDGFSPARRQRRRVLESSRVVTRARVGVEHVYRIWMAGPFRSPMTGGAFRVMVGEAYRTDHVRSA